MDKARVGVVVIGRNEGERLRRCLLSAADAQSRVYVDSGSTDGSQALARELAFEVVDLDTSRGFTAARARNAGLDHLVRSGVALDYVQFVDGDCELRSGWLKQALGDFTPERAAVFGRRRERHPERNLYHRACDREWTVPQGEVSSCGGDVLFRLKALRQVDGYNDALIAGEEPELCLRLRQKGWRIYCNAREMTWHDVAIDRIGQWWLRAKRTGYGFGVLVSLHGKDEPSWNRLLLSAVCWSALMLALPLALLASVVTSSPIFLALALGLGLLLVAGIVRTAWRERRSFSGIGKAIQWSALLYLSKLAQAQGLLEQRWKRMRSSPDRIIEYK